MWRLARSLRQSGSSWQLGGAAVARLTVAAGSPAPSGSPGGWYEWLAQSSPVHWAEDGLVALQAAAGLPWWAAIVCGGALLRSAVTLPLAAHQGRLLAKVGPRAEGAGLHGAAAPRCVTGGVMGHGSLLLELEYHLGLLSCLFVESRSRSLFWVGP